LFSTLTFDPLAFSTMDRKKQGETLRKIVALDFAKLDAQRRFAFEDRQLVNRDLSNAKAKLHAIPVPAKDLPQQPVVVADLIKERDAILQVNRANDNQRHGIAKIDRDLETARATAAGYDHEIQSLKDRLATAEARLGSANQELDRIAGIRSAEIERVAKLEDKSTAEVDEKIAAAESTNAQIRSAAYYNAQAKEVDELTVKSDGLNEKIAGIDKQKSEALAAAKFPVPGLAFDDDGVTLNGLPFNQASAAEQLRISAAMGLAMNPSVKVLLIRDGSLLDEDSLKMLAEMAEAAGGQVTLERVGKGAECSVIIEDGVVSEDRTKKAEEESTPASA
jgi:hypothetical protein